MMAAVLVSPDPERVAQFKERWALLGLPVTPEAIAFITKPRVRPGSQVFTDERTQREDALLDAIEESGR